MKEIEGRVTRNTETSFEEAVRYFKGKIPVTSKEYYQLSAEYQKLAFTVSGYTHAQIIRQFHERLLNALEEGTTIKVFQEAMNEFLEEQGYEGITPFQADNIFRTNIQSAFQAGHYERMTQPDVMRLRPYWQYDAVNDNSTRPSHLAMDGRVFPADSPVWDIWYPPNGFRCRCTVRTLSRRQVEQQGLTVEEKVPAMAELADGRTVSVLPDPHFGTNPAKTQFEPDLKTFPPPLKAAYQKYNAQGS